MSESQSVGGGSPAVGSAPPGGAPSAEPMSIPEACFSIFFAPSRVFAERQGKGWVLPLIILTVLISLVFFGARPYMQPAIDAEMARATAAVMRANPQLTAAQMQAGRAMQEKFGAVVVVVIIPVTVVAIGFTLWLVGRFVESKQSLRAAFVVATFAYFPRLLAWPASGVIAVVRDPSHLTGLYNLTLGPGYFLDLTTASPILIALVGRLDVFIVWTTVLLAIGLHVTGKVPKGQAYIVAAIMWIIGAVPGLFGALRTAGS